MVGRYLEYTDTWKTGFQIPRKMATKSAVMFYAVLDRFYGSLKYMVILSFLENFWVPIGIKTIKQTIQYFLPARYWFRLLEKDLIWVLEIRQLESSGAKVISCHVKYWRNGYWNLSQNKIHDFFLVRKCRQLICW